MGREGNALDVRAPRAAPPESPAAPGPAGPLLNAKTPNASLVLPCPLVVLGTTREAETGRPLGDLLRGIGYL